jgi:hypothetical protein
VKSDLGKFLTRFLDLRNFTHPSTTSAFTTWYSLRTTNSMHRTRNICVLNAHSSRSATAILRDAIGFSLQCQVEINICNGCTIHLAASNQRHHRPLPFILSPSSYLHTPTSSVSSASSASNAHCIRKRPLHIPSPLRHANYLYTSMSSVSSASPSPP